MRIVYICIRDNFLSVIMYYYFFLMESFIGFFAFPVIRFFRVVNDIINRV